jgi:hypothetical protein
MATTGNAILLPLESMGSSGKKYGATSASQNKLEPLTAQGSQFYHASGAVLLPSLEVRVTMIEGGMVAGAVILPRLTAAGHTGGVGKAVLPALTALGAMSNFGWGVADLTLPRLTVAGSVNMGERAVAAITLPLLVVAGHTGSAWAVRLPALQAAGHVQVGESASGAIILPALRSSGNVVIASMPSAGAILLPALVAGPYGSAYLSLPSLFAGGYGGVLVVPGEGFEGWIINLRNNGVSRITAWPFTQLVRWGNRTMAIGAGGVYEIGGDTDAGAPISWAFETGLNDLAAPGMKRVPYLYVDGIIEGRVLITAITDDNSRYVYEYENLEGARHQPHRRELGKGIRTRNIAFGMSSTRGAYVEIDALEPEATVTQRSI